MSRLPLRSGSVTYLALTLRRRPFLFLPVILLSCLLFNIPPARSANFDTSKDSWAVLGGYGQSIPGWGQTTERVETFDFVPRYSHLVFDKIGSGWYQGFHSTLVELPVHFIVSPDVSTMIGVNFLACYTFTANEQWRPYLFAGGGPLYSFADIPGMGADWNGNYQFALGLEHVLNPTRALLFEFRFHHVSNVGTKEPNVPLNSAKILLGIRF